MRTYSVLAYRSTYSLANEEGGIIFEGNRYLPFFTVDAASPGEAMEKALGIVGESGGIASVEEA